MLPRHIEQFEVVLPFFIFLTFSLLQSGGILGQTKEDSLSYYNQLIIQPTHTNDLADAYRFYNAYKEKSLQRNNSLQAVYAMRQLSEIQRKLGYVDESELIDIEALTILNSIEPTEYSVQYTIGIYNHLGMLYRLKKNYNQALQFYELASSMTNDVAQRTYIENNMGFVYLQMNALPEALQQFERAHRSSIQANDSLQIARALDNLGVVESQLNEPEARLKLEQALAIRERLNYSSGIQTSLEHLSEHFAKSADTTRALKFASRALHVAQEAEDLKSMESALALNILLGRNKLAPEYIKIKDSIANEKNRQRSDFNKYVSLYTEKEKQFQKSEVLNAQRKTIIIVVISVALLLLITLLFLYIIQRTKHKRKVLQQVYETESNISKKVHDEVANDVFQFMTKLQLEQKFDETLIDDLEHIYHKTRDISKEHAILDNSRSYRKELEELLLNYQNSQTNIISRNISAIDWNKVSQLKRKTIYKVLQELLINMTKHSEATLVYVSFEKSGNHVHIAYSDNGIGCDLRKGTGLSNTENRIESMKGKINFESEPNKGFKVSIII